MLKVKLFSCWLPSAIDMSAVVLRFQEFQRSGILEKAEHLLNNLEKLIECDECKEDFPHSCHWNVSDVGTSNEIDIDKTVDVALFLLDNERELAKELGYTSLVRRQLHAANGTEDDDLMVLLSTPAEHQSHTGKIASSTKGKQRFTPTLGVKKITQREDTRLAAKLLGDNLLKLKSQYVQLAKVSGDPLTNICNALSCAIKHHETCFESLKTSGWEDREKRLIEKHRLTLKAREDQLGKAFELEKRALFEEAKQKAKDEIIKCSVCFVDEKRMALLPCGHTFCNNCVRKMRESGDKCGFCRMEIQTVIRAYFTD